MDRASRGEIGPVEWAAATLTMPGEAVSGDRWFVLPHADGVVFGAADGLGHGREAAEAADSAVEAVQQQPEDAVDVIVKRCHERLVGTRGVVLGVASLRFGDGVMTWLGVGNVEGSVVPESPAPTHKAVSLIPQPGVVGYKLPALKPVSVRLGTGDVVLFATDGVESGRLSAVRPLGPPPAIAHRILANHFKGSDDALVLAARYRGS